MEEQWLRTAIKMEFLDQMLRLGTAILFIEGFSTFHRKSGNLRMTYSKNRQHVTHIKNSPTTSFREVCLSTLKISSTSRLMRPAHRTQRRTTTPPTMIILRTGELSLSLIPTTSPSPQPVRQRLIAAPPLWQFSPRAFQRTKLRSRCTCEVILILLYNRDPMTVHRGS